jgi:hypothetical protein
VSDIKAGFIHSAKKEEKREKERHGEETHFKENKDHVM